MELIIALFYSVVVFAIGYLVGAKQERNRLQPKPYEIPNEVKEQLQKLAGIIEHDRNEGSKMLLDIMDGLAKKKDGAAKMFNCEFIELPVLKEKLKVDKAKKVLDKSIEATNRHNEYRKNNPLPKKVKDAMVNPLDKSKKIMSQTEYNLYRDKMAEKIKDKVKLKKCGCGRSEDGYCSGLHRIPMDKWKIMEGNRNTYNKGVSK